MNHASETHVGRRKTRGGNFAASPFNRAMSEKLGPWNVPTADILGCPPSSSAAAVSSPLESLYFDKAVDVTDCPKLPPFSPPERSSFPFLPPVRL